MSCPGSVSDAGHCCWKDAFILASSKEAMLVIVACQQACRYGLLLLLRLYKLVLVFPCPTLKCLSVFLLAGHVGLSTGIRNTKSNDNLWLGKTRVGDTAQIRQSNMQGHSWSMCPSPVCRQKWRHTRVNAYNLHVLSTVNIAISPPAFLVRLQQKNSSRFVGSLMWTCLSGVSGSRLYNSRASLWLWWCDDASCGNGKWPRKLELLVVMICILKWRYWLKLIWLTFVLNSSS